MKNKNSPGPDGIPAEVYKLVFRKRPDLLLGVFNACLKQGIFQTLISKGKGEPELHSAYRRLYMLDKAGKMLQNSPVVDWPNQSALLWTYLQGNSGSEQEDPQ